MHDLVQYFPALESVTYLNTPAAGLMPRPIAKWREEHNTQFFEHQGDWHITQSGTLNKTREKIADFFGANLNEISLIQNFSVGLNSILESIPSNSKILFLDKDYPSISLPILKKNFKFVKAEVNENIEESIVKSKPDVFVFSIVQWLNGIKISTNFLREIKLQYPNLILIADGTQFLATESFNFSNSPIDILITSAYKWLCSGFGNGLLIIKTEILARITPTIIGFNSTDYQEDLPINKIEKIKQFEPGHLDSLNFGTLWQSLDFKESLDTNKLYNSLKKLALIAKESLYENELIEKGIFERNDHSPIFNIKGDAKLFDKLISNKVICSQRGGGIRIGFHYYNNEDDLNKLIEVIKKQ